MYDKIEIEFTEKLLEEWTKDYYRFFKNRVSYERNPIIKINLKKNEYIIKNLETNIEKFERNL